MDSKTILLVEDNQADEDLALLALRKNKFRNEVVVARDGAEAIDYLFGTGRFAGRDTTKRPAIILLDLQLPKLGGLEVLKLVRADERTKLIPVIILSSSKEDKDLVTGYTLGANSYIRKPVDFHEFNEVVKQMGMYWLSINEPPPGGC